MISEKIFIDLIYDKVILSFKENNIENVKVNNDKIDDFNYDYYDYLIYNIYSKIMSLMKIISFKYI